MCYDLHIYPVKHTYFTTYYTYANKQLIKFLVPAWLYMRNTEYETTKVHSIENGNLIWKDLFFWPKMVISSRLDHGSHTRHYVDSR